MLRSTWKVSADEGHTSHVFVGRRACAHLVLAYRFLVRRPWARIGEMRPDIVPGAVFPDYELPDHRGKHRTLSELQQGEPLVLVCALRARTGLLTAPLDPPRVR